MDSHPPFLLSASGSTRATAYSLSNKVVTLDGRTHVVWLDAVAKVCGRTYDHARREWSEARPLFDGCDNHTSPALGADASGHLRLVFGAHGWWGNWNQGRFQHAVSAQPNSLDRWREPENFGYNATYAALTRLDDGFDAVVYRGGEPPSGVLFQRQRAKGGWSHPLRLMTQEIPPQYTHWGARLAGAPGGRLYVAAHFYNESLHGTLGVAVLTSPDNGETWTDLAGEPVRLPITFASRFALPHPSNGYCSGLVTDSIGRLWTLSTSPFANDRSLLLSHWDGRAWDTRDLAGELPAERVSVAATMTIDAADRLHAVVDAVTPGNRALSEIVFGDPTTEVFHLWSADGGATFRCRMISDLDPTTPNWLGNISQPGSHHRVEHPVILFTHGVKGATCASPEQTQVYAALTVGP